jgi:hypothetical protein
MRDGCRFAFLILLLIARPASAATVVAYSFKGTVISSVDSPWQVPIPNFSPVLGAFIYDADSQPTHDLGSCDCVGYRQQRLNGFFAKFGNVSVRADDYVVEVLNNFPQPQSQDADVVSISFSSGYSPPLELPLVVDSVPRSAGLFSVKFAANPDLLSSPALPRALSLANFHSKIGVLSDTTDGLVDVAFTITSLKPFDLVPGDYDVDNDVDAADYSKWKSTFGSKGELVADGNHDGVVDAADYTRWRDALNPTAAISSLLNSNAVPEPSAFVCYVFASTWMFTRYERDARNRRTIDRDLVT